MGSSVFCLSIRSIALIPFILVEFYNQCKKYKEAKMEKKKKLKKLKATNCYPHSPIYASPTTISI